MSYKTLTDPNKKKMYQKIMNEAKEKTEFEREKENKKRKKLGRIEFIRPTSSSTRLL
jgi:DnaJ family protein C protein 8